MDHKDRIRWARTKPDPQYPIPVIQIHANPPCTSLLGFPLQPSKNHTNSHFDLLPLHLLLLSKRVFGFWKSLRNGSETLKGGEENIVRQEAMRLAQPVLPGSNRPRWQCGLEAAPEHSLGPPRWLGGFDGQEHDDEAYHQDTCGGDRERGCHEHPSSFGGMLHMNHMILSFFFCF